MTTRQMVEKYYGLLIAGKFEDAGKFVSPNAKRWISGEGSWPFGGWQTEQSMADIYAVIRERFPNGLQISVQNIIVEADRASVNIRNYAERVDGRIYDNQIVFLLRVQNGLIVEQKEFLDTIMVKELFCGEMDDTSNRKMDGPQHS